MSKRYNSMYGHMLATSAYSTEIPGADTNTNRTSNKYKLLLSCNLGGAAEV